MKFLRRISIVLGIIALSLVAYFTAVKATSLTAADVTDSTALRTPEITFNEQTGIASVDISVMIYNVCGLPWPIACGKTSRQTDASDERIPIACRRGKALEEIGDTLSEMRKRGVEPDIVMLQEAFISASEEVAIRGGYSNRVFGPGPDGKSENFSDRASQEFIEARQWGKGEKSGKKQSSGLLIASNFPIAETFKKPFYQWECAGFDCLANKGVIMARVEIPGVPDALEITTTHYNSKGASGVSLDRSLEAHQLQVAATGEFLEEVSDYDLPAIWGGDLNMRRSEERIAYFTGRFGEDLNEVSSHCLENPESCEVAAEWGTEKPWFETQDLQGWVSGKRVSIEPIRIEAAFNETVDGLMPSDHNALVVFYRLSWQVPND